MAAVLSERVLDQNGPKWSKRPFGQNDLIPNWILAFARPKWNKMVYFGPIWPEEDHLVHLGPPTVLWPFVICFPPPQVSLLCFFCTEIQDSAHQKLFSMGLKKFLEGASSGTFSSSPHTFCTPPYHGPKFVSTTVPTDLNDFGIN